MALQGSDKGAPPARCHRRSPGCLAAWGKGWSRGHPAAVAGTLAQASRRAHAPSYATYMQLGCWTTCTRSRVACWQKRFTEAALLGGRCTLARNGTTHHEVTRPCPSSGCTRHPRGGRVPSPRRGRHPMAAYHRPRRARSPSPPPRHVTGAGGRSLLSKEWRPPLAPQRRA